MQATAPVNAGDGPRLDIGMVQTSLLLQSRQWDSQAQEIIIKCPHSRRWQSLQLTLPPVDWTDPPLLHFLLFPSPKHNRLRPQPTTASPSSSSSLPCQIAGTDQAKIQTSSHRRTPLLLLLLLSLNWLAWVHEPVRWAMAALRMHGD